MEDNPEEILERKLNDPEAVLNPSESITLLNHCTKLGEQNATQAANRETCLVLGNTGAGKSTTINAWMGCRMKAEIDETDEEIIIVDPESPRAEVMPIGHGGQSRTFMPQIAPDPDHPNKAYCDCPGFSDNRGAEINIANAINIRSVLQQATGVKAVFLTSYNGLSDDRGSGIRNMAAMCKKMFGGADNLRRYQDSVLLGITKAPHYNTSGQPLSINSIRLRLNRSNSDIATILANRIFLFDPLDRATDNPDFWSLARCRNEIAQLDSIPQREASALFQTTLTDSDQVHLLTTVRRLKSKMVNAIRQAVIRQPKMKVMTLDKDGPEVSSIRYLAAIPSFHVYELAFDGDTLQQLRIINHPEVDRLIEGQAWPAINTAILQRVDTLKSSANAHNFRDAEDQLDLIEEILSWIDDVPLVVNRYALRRHLAHCKEAYEAQQKRQAELAHLQAELEWLNRRPPSPPCSIS
jgi:ABC-type dipeptide/oligopeptide/nickel transport system ATPase component